MTGGALPQQAATGRAVVRATVRAGEIDTSYLRVGRGTPVLVLDERAEEHLAALLESADPRWGIVLPDRTTVAAVAAAGEDGGTAFVRWLDGFLQGLGIEEALVVAPVLLADELQAFATVWHGRLRGVMLRGMPQDHAMGDDLRVQYVAVNASWAEILAALPTLGS